MKQIILMAVTALFSSAGIMAQNTSVTLQLHFVRHSMSRRSSPLRRIVLYIMMRMIKRVRRKKTFSTKTTSYPRLIIIYGMERQTAGNRTVNP